MTLQHNSFVLRRRHTTAVVKVKVNRSDDYTKHLLPLRLTLVHALALADDVHLRRVLGAVGAHHAHTAALYPLRLAALVAAGPDAVGHLDHLAGSAAVLLKELPVLFLLAGRRWNKEFCILVLTDPWLTRNAVL